MQDFSPFQGLRTHRAETSYWCSWRWSWFETCSLLSHHLWGAVRVVFGSGKNKVALKPPLPPKKPPSYGKGPALRSAEAFQRRSRKTGGISIAYLVGYRPDSGHRNLWRRPFCFFFLGQNSRGFSMFGGIVGWTTIYVCSSWERHVKK